MQTTRGDNADDQEEQQGLAQAPSVAEALGLGATVGFDENRPGRSWIVVCGLITVGAGWSPAHERKARVRQTQADQNGGQEPEGMSHGPGIFHGRAVLWGR